MTRKMLKEERELRLFLKDGIVMYDKWMKDGGNRKLSHKINALIRAVREDCAKVVEECGNDELYETVADAVRKGKPVQQCTYCGLMKDSITSNGECQTCRATHL